jgi:hypothetical protein
VITKKATTMPYKSLLSSIIAAVIILTAALPAAAITPKSAVRVIHASSDTLSVDVLFGGTVAFANSGTYDLEVRPAGPDTTVYSIGPVNLEGGTAYSAFAIGTLDVADSADFSVQFSNDVDNTMLGQLRN